MVCRAPVSLITWIIPSKKRRPDESRRNLVDYGVSITRNKFISLQCTTIHQESVKYQTSVRNNATTVEANPFILQQRKFLGRSIALQIPYSLKPSKEQIVGNNSMTRHHQRKGIAGHRLSHCTGRLWFASSGGERSISPSLTRRYRAGDFVHSPVKGTAVR